MDGAESTGVTKGKRDLEQPMTRARPPLVLSSSERATDESLRLWCHVREAGRCLNRALRALGTSLPQWRVLYATERLIRETGDCVSQIAVARRIDMDMNTTSNVMRRLERKGLVDRAPAYVDSANRVLVTAAGEALLVDAQSAVARFSLNLATYYDDDH
jgi:DNA-binding MarR family transcriptional regulator